MRKYSRLPALIILAATLLASVALALTQKAAPGIDQLSQKIAAGSRDPQTWFDYAAQLRKSQKFSGAADAYQHALRYGYPDVRAATFGRAITLAQDPADETGDTFFSYINKELIPADAKTALEVLDSPEAENRKSSPQYDPTRQSAERQAVD